ncbi:uncharacterized protein [Salmo salar]|uniref:Uncharacterized protein LOC106573442 n=1 Tax=Salmo salar TaxID=8030 RepID=A0A1S3ML63_SALSA|nr:uncharacterized protein LOC106573442 [Salmo salar]XP_014003969.1 uncharacterized protein LOC106573442 [Salmo salar]XP_014003970.1 uncharacterized protein LOC106573442 [Salmo salar]|eukprot:XP_014003968.1 PREDICTED: uncharacterized protein LOC106573442 [Salmo salar]
MLFRGVTAQRISKTITLYLNETAPPNPSPGPPIGPPLGPLSALNDAACTPPALTPGPTKPLLLMLPWLGSRPQAVAKYCEIYFRTGFDVLIVESEVSQFLWPRWGLDYGARVLDVLQSDRFVSRPLLVHAFSIGGYTFTQLLVHMSHDTQKYHSFIKRIKGHIYDSLVLGSLERMATGLSKNLFPRLESLVKRASILYFRAFKCHTVDYFNTGIDVFRNNPVTAPALVFFCQNDALCDPESMEEIIAYWRKRGMEVTDRKWEESTHAGHLRRHPQEYLSTLETYLQSLSMVPLKAKM